MRDTCILRGNQDICGVHAEYMRDTCGTRISEMINRRLVLGYEKYLLLVHACAVLSYGRVAGLVVCGHSVPPSRTAATGPMHVGPLASLVGAVALAARSWRLHVRLGGYVTGAVHPPPRRGGDAVRVARRDACQGVHRPHGLRHVAHGHHLLLHAPPRLISLAAVIGAALPVAIWAKSRKCRLLSGAPLAGLLPVVM